MTDEQPETDKGEETQPKLVMIPEDKLAELMSQMTLLGQQVDFLKNQVEASKSAPQVDRSIGDGGSQEAILHTLSRIKNAREMQNMQIKSKSEDMIELAVDYALADFMKNPPKNRMR